MTQPHLTYTDLQQERDRLDAESARAHRMWRAMHTASNGRPRRLVEAKLQARMDELDRALAEVDAEMVQRASERPVCVICGDINVCRGGDLCHSCSRDLGARRAADVEVRAA